MDLERYALNRTWAFDALDRLQEFLDDSDFEGDAADHLRAIDRRRREFSEGKYRVVLLGAFNVGKTALVNALLGDEYLPTVLEECTAKITHVSRGPSLEARLRLAAPLTDEELRLLRDLIEARTIGARVEPERDGPAVRIVFSTNSPKALLLCMNAMITMNADDDYPQLRRIRDKFEEIEVRAPTEFLPEDVALVDSPGVRSICDTNERISHGLIPRSHLVVCLIDSQSAGNDQDREYIQKITRAHGRKVFFVINKSDQLNAEEIDPQGRRGPSKNLLRALAGIVDDPEIFFVSSLYALLSGQLKRQRIRFADLEGNQKVKIPIGMLKGLVDSEDPAPRLAEYLMERSELARFKNRLLEFLYAENREGAILESVCRFVDDRAWKLARPLEIKVDMARDVPRLHELRIARERISSDLATDRARARKAAEKFSSLASGDGGAGGYERIIDDEFGQVSIDADVLGPLRQWLEDDDNLQEARDTGFEALARRIEHTLDTFVAARQGRVQREIGDVEKRIIDDYPDVLSKASAPGLPAVASDRAEVGDIRAGMAGSYLGFGFLGALLGAGAGLVAGQLVTALGDMGMIVFPATGAAIGLVIGLIARAATGREVLRERLLATVHHRVGSILSGQETDAEGRPGVVQQLTTTATARRSAFGRRVREAFDRRIGDLEGQVQKIRGEEDDLKRQQEELIARLEPKIESLQDLGARARRLATRGALNVRADEDDDDEKPTPAAATPAPPAVERTAPVKTPAPKPAPAPETAADEAPPAAEAVVEKPGDGPADGPADEPVEKSAEPATATPSEPGPQGPPDEDEKRPKDAPAPAADSESDGEAAGAADRAADV